jgi:hypothetical protein
MLTCFICFSNIYFVYSGTYTGQVSISRANIKSKHIQSYPWKLFASILSPRYSVYGQTNSATSYASNVVSFTDNVPASTAGSDAQSATIRVLATGVRCVFPHIHSWLQNSFQLKFKQPIQSQHHQYLWQASYAVPGYRPFCRSWAVWVLRMPD